MIWVLKMKLYIIKIFKKINVSTFMENKILLVLFSKLKIIQQQLGKNEEKKLKRQTENHESNIYQSHCTGNSEIRP
jgi:hypothetical protein